MAKADSENITTVDDAANEPALIDQLTDRESPFCVADGMCDSILDVENVASALRVFADSSEAELTNLHGALHLIARMLSRTADDLQERHEKLFHALHPNRDHFEKIGWPSANPPNAESSQQARAEG